MTTLIEYWQMIKREPLSDRAQRLASVRSFLSNRNRYNTGLGKNREWRFTNSGLTRSEIVSYQAQFKKFGSYLGEFIRDGEPGLALDLINARENRPIRNQRDNWIDILDIHFAERFEKCNDCGAIEFADDVSWAYDDYPICEVCRDRNYVWSDHRDTFVSYDDADDEDEEDSIIGEYHSTEIGHIPSEYDKRKQRVLLGLELEFECSGDREDRASELLNAIGYSEGRAYCGVENDGSLDNGFEMVTGYTGLDVHAKQLEFFKKAWRGVKSHDTRTCGLHVHVCKNGVTMLHAAKMIFFINESSNQKLIRAIARRDSNGYSQIKNKKASYEWLKNAKQHRDPLAHLNDDRYEALNFKNQRTIEFRLFKGTLKYQTIMACLEFTFATWHFTRDTGMSDLTIENFIKFICEPENKRDTPNLRHYLIEKGFSLPKNAVAKVHPKLMGQTSPDLQLAEV